MFNATVTGNIGRDPDFQTTQSGQMVAKFSLAVRQQKKDAPAFWVKVEVWGKQAEYVSNYLRKGASVCVTGQVAEEQWNDKTTGELKKAVVVKNALVESWQARAEAGRDADRAPAAAPAPLPLQQQQAWNSAPSSYEPDDSIPF
jgi:single-strand DNA-binding protein